MVTFNCVSGAPLGHCELSIPFCRAPYIAGANMVAARTCYRIDAELPVAHSKRWRMSAAKPTFLAQCRRLPAGGTESGRVALHHPAHGAARRCGPIQYYRPAVAGTERSIGVAALMRQQGFGRFE